MKSLQSCLFCVNTPIYKINSDSGVTDHTTRKYMLDFFGSEIAPHLRPDDAICNRCMHLMESVAKLKHRLLPLIFRFSEDEDRKPISLGKKWDMFASISFDDDFLETRSPTPSSFLIFNRSEPYNISKERALNERERNRSASRISVARSEGDDEVNAVFSKRRRKRRGHNWTHRKNGRYSSASVGTTTRMTRSRTKALASLPVFDTEHYENVQPSYLADNENDFDTFVDELHACSTDGCNFICEDIDLMAQHKSTRHHQNLMFWCDCGKKYTSSDDLAIHKKTHQEYTCVACKKELYSEFDLRKHWEEHVKQSVLCDICNKRFIDCNHKRKIHNSDVPSRERYNYGKHEEQVKSNMENKNFQIRIRTQDSESIQL